MRTLEAELAPWASLDHLAIDHRFPYAVAGPTPYLGYLSLYDRYADSELGEYHGGQVPRFVADFGYDAKNNYRQMVRDLGFNADARDHMQSASKATDALLMGEYSTRRLKSLTRWLPPLDIPIVRLVSPLHDVGENSSPALEKIVGGVIGDIAHGGKTLEDKALESKIRLTIFEKFYADLPDEVMQRVEAISSHSEDSAAHQTYVWGHDLEADQTANIAAGCALSVLEQGGPYDHRFDQLTKLAREVGGRTRQQLQPATKYFSYIGDVLMSDEILHERLENSLQRGY
jgi:hypothetical protein